MTLAIGKSTRGFTLVELMLVLGLLLATLAFAVPSLTGYSNRLSRQQELRAIRTSLLQTRRQAIESGAVVRWDATNASRQHPELRLRVSPNRPIEFYPNGVCSGARIELLDDQQVVFAVLVCSGATGNIYKNPQY